MKSTTWRSDLIVPLVYDHETAQMEDTIPDQVMEQLGIKVPRDGWYGFCFGRGGDQGGAEYSTLLQTHRLVIQSASCMSKQCYDQAQTQPQQKQQRWPLPLTHEDSKQKKQKKFNDQATSHLSSIHVGKLVYLMENSTVLVVRDRVAGVGRVIAQEAATGEDTGPRSTVIEQLRNYRGKKSDERIEMKPTMFHWCLVEAPLAVRDQDINPSRQDKHTMDDTTNQPQQQQQPQPLIPTDALHTLGRMHPSRLVCFTCIRSFGSIHAVLCHAQDAHRDPTHSAARDPTTSSDLSSPSMMATTTTTMIITGTTTDTLWNRPLQVAFEDDSMAVVIKPQGMAVMGSTPSLCRSNLLLPFQKRRQEELFNAPSTTIKKLKVEEEKHLTFEGVDDVQHKHIKKSEKEDEKDEDWLNKPIPVHRLDAPTGGLLVIAKTKTAERQLKHSFATQTCHKRYRALLVGKLHPREGECHTPMNGGKPTHTQYKVVEYYKLVLQEQGRTQQIRLAENSDSHSSATAGDRYNEANGEIGSASLANGFASAASTADATTSSEDRCITMVDLYPKTGRKHQLRKHMTALGHPILGDGRYGKGFAQNIAAATASVTSGTGQSPSGEPKTEDADSSITRTMVLPSSLPLLYLWAMEVTLPHPISGVETNIQMDFPPPDWPISYSMSSK
jgi:23S rRNA-/tRNA-specific pseudouridylate synthase